MGQKVRNLALIFDRSRLLCALVSKRISLWKSKTFSWLDDDQLSFRLRHFTHLFPNFTGVNKVRNLVSRRFEPSLCFPNEATYGKTKTNLGSPYMIGIRRLLHKIGVVWSTKLRKLTRTKLPPSSPKKLAGKYVESFSPRSCSTPKIQQNKTTLSVI